MFLCGSFPSPPPQVRGNTCGSSCCRNPNCGTQYPSWSCKPGFWSQGWSPQILLVLCLKYFCAWSLFPFYSAHRYIGSIASHQILEGRVAATLNDCKTVITFKIALNYCKYSFMWKVIQAPVVVLVMLESSLLLLGASLTERQWTLMLICSSYYELQLGVIT